MTEALITGKIISWALDRNRETLSGFASRIHVKQETIDAWVSETSRPSLPQARNLAKKLQIPLGYLYLNSPPSDTLPLPDLRTQNNEYRTRPTPNFLEVLYDALRKRDWYHEYLRNEGAKQLPFVGKYKVGDSHAVVAADIAQYLGIDNKLRQQCKTWEQLLSELVIRAENAHILVLRSGIVGNNTRRTLDAKEFRGFAISDNLAPLIFVNSSDYKVAQIFTLAHELAHLWVNQSGISNPEYLLRSSSQHNSIERFCNMVAAELLVPSASFELVWSESQDLNENLKHLARYFRVSQFVILRRAYDLDRITERVFRDKYDELLSESKPKGGGGDFGNLFVSRNGRLLPRSILSAMGEGKILPSEAAALLNLSVLKVRNIDQYIMGVAA